MTCAASGVLSSPQQSTLGRLPALVFLATALSLAACRGPAPVSPSDPEAAADSQPAAGEAEVDPQQSDEAAPAGAVAVTGIEAPLIEFQPVNLTPLYQGFLADPRAIAVLRSGLAGRLSAPSVPLKVVWDQRTMSAMITLHMPERDERFELLADAVADNQPVAAQEVQPLLAALGAYRAYLGASFDLRILSFGIRLSWWDPDSASHCTIAGVTNDPEGRELAPCFECVHVGDEELRMCRAGEKWPALLGGPDAGRRMLSSALRSSL